jgi:type II secretory pathway pseudopilin PulG
MNRSTSKTSAFTLLELILVMAILTLVMAEIAPSLRGFGVSRSSSDTANLIVTLANYARTQSAAEGRVYRLNFDQNAGQMWLTVSDDGVFDSPTASDWGKKFDVAPGLKMVVNFQPAASAPMLSPEALTPQQVEQQQGQDQGQATTPAAGMSGGQAGSLQTIGNYVSFQPTGRTDPIDIHLTDKLGGVIEVACASPTELYHVVPQDEMTR